MVRRRPVGLCLFALVASFAPIAASAAQTVLLDFSSPSCGPCRRMRPTIGRLAAAGYDVREVDVSRDGQTAQRFGVESVPTFIVLVDGKPYGRLTGATSYEQLTAMIAKSEQLAGAARIQPAQFSGAPSTFADPAADLQTPQEGRIVELEPPGAAALPRPSAQFGGGSSAAAPQAGAYADLAKLTAATVRLSVEDGAGKSTGTGTIVDARNGEALILTCGHIFRESQGRGRIEVTLFDGSPQGAVKRGVVEGRMVAFDLDRDLGLVSIWIDAPVTVAPIAPATAAARPTEPVTTMGCSNGADPTPQQTRVTTVDRYTGPPNVQVAGAPVEGRSGGGLFNAAGQVVGVCFAADPGSNEGLYAGLRSIHAKMDELKLTAVYQQPSTGIALAAATEQPKIRGQEPSEAFGATAAPPATPLSVPSTPDAGLGAATAGNPFGSLSTAAPGGAVTPTPPTLSPVERATLEELANRSGDSEVICIIRPQQPGGKSEVITVSGASPAFVGALQQAAAAGGATRR
ncbi:MAG: hypothetical protein CMJ58_06610 [Planctomycetaceae bacterium]|nr:hypothetical protein [Planctomycetaceae bacterium]